MKSKMQAALFVIAALAITAFESDSRYPKPEDTANGYLLTVMDQELSTQLGTQFRNLADKIDRIDAFDNQEFGTYYRVSGKKDNQPVTFSLKVTREEIETGTYTYINPAVLETLAKANATMVVYCYWNRSQTVCSHLNPYTNPICGTKESNCAPW